MARYIYAKCRLCRRVGDKLMLKGERCLSAKCAVEHRNGVPGQKANLKHRTKMSDRGLQLREKQKSRYTYGILERQYRKTFALAGKLPGVTGENLVVLLEKRLDNIVYRLGFANSRAQSRQIVRHGHITLNGRKTDIPSCMVKSGDVIGWRTNSMKNEYYKIMSETIKDHVLPSWLSLDMDNMTGKVLSIPTHADIETKFDVQAIVEYYSR
jgi:small subunit ribosomal protein S4